MPTETVKRRGVPFVRHWRFAALLILLAGLIALTGMATIGAEHSRRFDVLTPISVHLLAMLLATLLAINLPQRALLILTTGATAVLLAHAAWGWLHQHALETIEPAPGIAASGRPLRVVALNTWHANRAPEHLSAYLRRAPGTVVLLSEAGPDKVALLSSLRDIYPHQASCAHTWECSLAILSKVPFEAVDINLEHYHQSPRVSVRIAHPDVPGGSLAIILTHVHRPTRSPSRHQHQLNNLSALLEGVRGPFILAGDFNAPPEAAAFARFLAANTLATPPCRLHTWPAWPLNIPQFPIDHVLTGQGVGLARLAIGPAVGSDHLPVVADLVAVPPFPDTRCG